MNLSVVRIEEAKRGDELTDQANSILSAFGHAGSSQVRGKPEPEFAESSFFCENELPGILVVGYSGEVATSAAVCIEETKTEGRYDGEGAVPYIGLRYLAITLIATDKEYRGSGHSKQLLASMYSLAENAQMDRLQVIWPVSHAIPFWEHSGFLELPFDTFGGDMERKISPVNPMSLLPPTKLSISESVQNRLRSVDLSSPKRS